MLLPCLLLPCLLLLASASARAAAPAPLPAPEVGDRAATAAGFVVAEDVASTVESSSELAASQALARRLQRMEGMEGVTVTVRGGVARLEGEVVDVEDRVLAGQVASQQPGISAVENQVQLSTRLSDRFDAAIRQVTGKLVRLLAATPLLVVAIAIVLAAWWTGRWLGRRTRLTRLGEDNPYLDGLVRRLVQWLVLLAGVLIALDVLGATALVGAVLGSAGVLGLVLGFAFKDIAENYVAGVLLSLRRPFAPGDHLRVEGFEGKVAALTSRATVMVTLEGNHLSLPNALVFKSVVLNFTRNPNRRFDFIIPVDPGESLGEAGDRALERIAAVPGVLTEPGPSWQIRGYEGAGIDLQFFGWVDQRHSDLGRTRSEALRQAKAALAEAGVEGPRSVHFVRNLPDADTAPRGTTGAEAEAASCDTSVNRDIDAQLAAEQRALSGDNLI
ncbi:hypothetical protein N799_00595 [Lysobacter arseniciresistens ZS79]|uniref:Small-conductance mechanosensitive channel n=1 Tax=Lysobacter arseniciresistens ZS79 TaxID=913325 RepID=A0A0A0F5S0_9GAMM|nr:mechanosensitive ion channel domain-containing protein [Lysobacter arseniciresistens]KGM57718.1 hypothetical protein N799_00595 [Lysobacter arseniciresistens ZS79]